MNQSLGAPIPHWAVERGRYVDLIVIYSNTASLCFDEIGLAAHLAWADQHNWQVTAELD